MGVGRLWRVEKDRKKEQSRRAHPKGQDNWGLEHMLEIPGKKKNFESERHNAGVKGEIGTEKVVQRGKKKSPSKPGKGKLAIWMAKSIGRDNYGDQRQETL